MGVAATGTKWFEGLEVGMLNWKTRFSAGKVGVETPLGFALSREH